MSDLSIKKRQTAKEIVGEYMDVVMDLAMTDHDEAENQGYTPYFPKDAR